MYKRQGIYPEESDFGVTPCVGVWIEIYLVGAVSIYKGVTPCVGVWIEILNLNESATAVNVTPCVGVWIEIRTLRLLRVRSQGHSLRGSVD